MGNHQSQLYLFLLSQSKHQIPKRFGTPWSIFFLKNVPNHKQKNTFDEWRLKTNALSISFLKTEHKLITTYLVFLGLIQIWTMILNRNHMMQWIYVNMKHHASINKYSNTIERYQKQNIYLLHIKETHPVISDKKIFLVQANSTR